MTYNEVFKSYNDEIGIEAFQQIAEYHTESYCIRHFIFQVKAHELRQAYILYTGEQP